MDVICCSEVNNIKGLVIKEFEQKFTQFADDMTICLGGPRGPLLAALNTLELFWFIIWLNEQQI